VGGKGNGNWEPKVTGGGAGWVFVFAERKGTHGQESLGGLEGIKTKKELNSTKLSRGKDRGRGIES